MDQSVSKYLQDAEIGEQTFYSQKLHRYPEAKSTDINGFRALISERLRTSNRAITAANSGQVNSTPGRHYSYSQIRLVYPEKFGGNA